ncbi:MAG: SMP-30/gluconolactonase/LRE family protein [Pseudomonadota bacterium]
MSIKRRTFLLAGGATVALGGCVSHEKGDFFSPHIEVFDAAALDHIDPNAPCEELGSGYTWAEGPTWDTERRALYFTDVPSNVAYKWTQNDGVQVFMDPSGVEGAAVGFREPGANGLWFARDGSLIICNHGRRAVERMSLDTMERETLIGAYQGNALNSPNDVVEASDGTLFFTDPPYGLEGLDASPLKEQRFNGVYRLSPDGVVHQIVEDMTFPNGIALSPDETRLYISQSDPSACLVREIVFNKFGAVSDDRVMFDATSLMADAAPGLLDGLCVGADGVLFATGPGGVLILSADGKLLGRINTGRATANCAFGEDGQTLFMTAHDRLLKIRTKSRGVQWS